MNQPERPSALRSMAALLSVIVLLGACSRDERLGQVLPATAPTTPLAAFERKEGVPTGLCVVEGSVREVCPSRGCWFDLEQEGLVRHVDVDPSQSFVLDPSWRAARVRVLLRATTGPDGPMLVASGIERRPD